MLNGQTVHFHPDDLARGSDNVSIEKISQIEEDPKMKIYPWMKRMHSAQCDSNYSLGLCYLRDQI